MGGIYINQSETSHISLNAWCQEAKNPLYNTLTINLWWNYQVILHTSHLIPTSIFNFIQHIWFHSRYLIPFKIFDSIQDIWFHLAYLSPTSIHADWAKDSVRYLEFIPRSVTYYFRTFEGGNPNIFLNAVQKALWEEYPIFSAVSLTDRPLSNRRIACSIRQRL